MKHIASILLLAGLYNLSAEAKVCQFVLRASISSAPITIKAKPNFDYMNKYIQYKLNNDIKKNLSEAVDSAIDQGETNAVGRESIAKEITLKDSDGNSIKLKSEDGKKFTVDLSDIIKSTMGSLTISENPTIEGVGTLYKMTGSNTVNQWETAQLLQGNTDDGVGEGLTAATITASNTMTVNEQDHMPQYVSESATSAYYQIPIRQNLHLKANVPTDVKNNDESGAAAQNDKIYYVISSSGIQPVFNEISDRDGSTRYIGSFGLSHYIDGAVLKIPFTTEVTLNTDNTLYYVGNEEEKSNVVINDGVSNNIGLNSLPCNYSQTSTDMNGNIEAGIRINVSNIGFFCITLGKNKSFGSNINLNPGNNNTGNKVDKSSNLTFTIKDRLSSFWAVDAGAKLTKKTELGLRCKYMCKKYEIFPSTGASFTGYYKANQLEIGPVLKIDLTKHFSLELCFSFCPGSKLILDKRANSAPYDIYTTPNIIGSLGIVCTI